MNLILKRKGESGDETMEKREGVCNAGWRVAFYPAYRRCRPDKSVLTHSPEDHRQQLRGDNPQEHDQRINGGVGERCRPAGGMQVVSKRQRRRIGH